MRKTLLIAALLAPIAAVAGPAEDAVAARQGYFKLIGSDMGVLAGMAKGEIDYDAARAQLAADNLAILSTYSIGKLIVEGTSSTDMPGVSNMTANAFSNPEGMMTAGQGFQTAAMAMKEVAGAGKAEMAGALGALGGSCKACHRDYKERD